MRVWQALAWACRWARSALGLSTQLAGAAWAAAQGWATALGGSSRARPSVTPRPPCPPSAPTGAAEPACDASAPGPRPTASDLRSLPSSSWAPPAPLAGLWLAWQERVRDGALHALQQWGETSAQAAVAATIGAVVGARAAPRWLA